MLLVGIESADLIHSSKECTPAVYAKSNIRPRSPTMHEVTIVQSVIEQVEQQVDRCGHDGRVTRLNLSVGRLSGVNVDSIRFAFEMLAPGTLLEAAALEIAEPAAVCCCRACGRRTEIDELEFECPVCASGEITVEGGRDLLIRTIELEDE